MYLSGGAIALGTLALLLVLFIVCALRHVEPETVSLLETGIIALIVLVMGFLISNAPFFVTLLASLLILGIGVFLGMYSQALIGVVILMATVMSVHEFHEGHEKL